jgi:hypothetical protein
VRHQQREWTQPVKRGHSVEKLLASPVEVFVIPAHHFVETMPASSSVMTRS